MEKVSPFWKLNCHWRHHSMSYLFLYDEYSIWISYACVMELWNLRQSNPASPCSSPYGWNIFKKTGSRVALICPSKPMWTGRKHRSKVTALPSDSFYPTGHTALISILANLRNNLQSTEAGLQALISNPMTNLMHTSELLLLDFMVQDKPILVLKLI